MLNQPLCAQAQAAYEAALNSPFPDWRAVAELFRAAMQAERVKRTVKPRSGDLPDYNVDRVKLLCRSPRIAVRFMDGEAIFTHVPSASGKPLNVGRALRVAISMYRSRKGVQRRAGLRLRRTTEAPPQRWRRRGRICQCAWHQKVIASTARFAGECQGFLPVVVGSDA